jgi:hypothetical protein
MHAICIMLLDLINLIEFIDYKLLTCSLYNFLNPVIPSLLGLHTLLSTCPQSTVCTSLEVG